MKQKGWAKRWLDGEIKERARKKSSWSFMTGAPLSAEGSPELWR